MSFVSQNFVRYRNGKTGSRVLLEGLHVVSPKEEVGVAQIVDAVSAKMERHALLTTQSRVQVDLNCPPEHELARIAHEEYRETIRSLLSDAGILSETQSLLSPFVTFSIHGMRDDHGMDIAVGTNYGKSVSPNVREWILAEINKWGEGFSKDVGKEKLIVSEEGKFCGWESIQYHRTGDGHRYHGYGPDFNYFQLEFSRTMRIKYQHQVIELLKQLGAGFEQEFK